MKTSTVNNLKTLHGHFEVHFNADCRGRYFEKCAKKRAATPGPAEKRAQKRAATPGGATPLLQNKKKEQDKNCFCNQYYCKQYNRLLQYRLRRAPRGTLDRNVYGSTYQHVTCTFHTALTHHRHTTAPPRNIIRRAVAGNSTTNRQAGDRALRARTWF